MGVLVATVDSNGKEDYTCLAGALTERFDHAVVCTPPDTHYELVGQLLEQGKHVFVEKPLAVASSEAKELLEMAANRSLKLQCGYIERFNPIVQSMKLPEFSVLERHNRHYPHVKDSILMDTAVHDIAIAIQKYGRPKSVIGTATHEWCSLLLTCERGTASINCSWLTGQKIRTINGISTITSEDILQFELEYFLHNHTIDWEALEVQKVIEDLEG